MMYIINVDIVFGPFIWDSEKEKANIKKHGVGFKLASRIFNDPVLYEEYDQKNSSSNEDRFNITGSIDDVLLLFVTLTDRDGRIRIISARKAKPNERRLYHENAQRIQDN